MKLKRTIALIISIFILFNIAILYLFIDGGSRHNILTMVAEGQNFIFQKKLERYTLYRDFSAAAEILDERLDYLQGLSNGKNTQTKAYFDDIHKTFVAAEAYLSAKNAKKHFKELFRRISSKYPENYQMHILLAQTLDENETKEAFEEIDKAIKLLGASSEAYRLGINLAWKTRNKEKLQSYCSSYKKNQYGGVQFQESTPLQELGLNRLVLNISTPKGNFFIENNGLLIGEEVEYEFPFPSPLLIDENFSLLLPIIPGISIAINKINYYTNGKEVRIDTSENFTLSSAESFFDANGSLLLANNLKSEIVEFLFKNKPEALLVDKLSLTVSINRQHLFSKSLCSSFN